MELEPSDPTATVCGVCGRGWADYITTAVTPTPSARCPFEHDHADDDDVLEDDYADDDDDTPSVWCDIHHAPHAMDSLACELRTAEDVLRRDGGDDDDDDVEDVGREDGDYFADDDADDAWIIGQQTYAADIARIAREDGHTTAAAIYWQRRAAAESYNAREPYRRNYGRPTM